MPNVVGKKTIGILAFQGGVVEHIKALKNAAQVLGVELEVIEVRTKAELDQVAGLVLPGGESTTIGKLLKRYELDQAIIERGQAEMPIYGTCAGAILLAKEIVGKQQALNLGLIDLQIERNAYGRQLDSFITSLPVSETFQEYLPGSTEISAVFIRAPKIQNLGPTVETLAFHNQDPVLVRQKNILLSTFHPELTDDSSVHQYFLKMIG